MIVKMRATAVRNFLMDSIDIYIRSQEIGATSYSYAKQIIMERITPDTEYRAQDEARIALGPEEAQQLMNDLWDAGIRPDDIRDRSEVVNAQKAHISDLQRVLSAFIEVARQ